MRFVISLSLTIQILGLVSSAVFHLETDSEHLQEKSKIRAKRDGVVFSQECANDEFRCSDGSCLKTEQLCGGYPSCKNGADEETKFCLNRTRRSANSTLISCTLPPRTSDKQYSVSCRNTKNCAQNPGEGVPELSVMNLTCNHGYAYDHMPSRTFCINGTWVPSIGKCKRRCPKLVPENVQLSCYRTKTGLNVPCNASVIEGMLVRIECLPYHHVQVPALYNEIRCTSTGTWSDPLYKCVADCGQQYSPPKKLISNGTVENFGDSPWNVAIYDVIDPKNPTQICGGTIISPHLIVSAAHCFYDENNRKLFGANRYQIAVAKIARDHAVKDNSQTRFYKIREIILSDKGYEGASSNYAGDIAILRTATKIRINAVVLPACIYLNDHILFNPGRNKLGKLVGWGYDSKNNPTDVLLTANLPFISRGQCLRVVSDDFQSSITLDKFCAGSVNISGSGARPGDSGGGLTYRDPQTGLFYLRGVVSVKDPSTSTSIAAFTDISFYVDWISQTRNKVESTAI